MIRDKKNHAVNLFNIDLEIKIPKRAFCVGYNFKND